MSLVYELVVTEGPLGERRFRLQPGGRARIGRTSREVPLFQDEQASLEHAELSWVTDGWWVADAGSETGTFVNGTAVRGTGVRVVPGDVVRVGQTSLRLEVRRQVPAWVGWSAAIGVPVAVVALGIAVLAARPVRYAPAVSFLSPIGTGPGAASSTIDVPLAFIRRYGVDHRHLAHRRVTDVDEDGFAELWLAVRAREVVVELGAEGAWEVRGELPRGCIDRETGSHWPDQECGGLRYAFDGERYAATHLDGAIAWLRPWVRPAPTPDAPTPPPTGTGPALPIRVSLLTPERLGGFLASRGVTERVHYLLCEEGLPGARAQVLTASGEVVPLQTGCLGELRVDGPGLGDALSDEDPIAVAFTAAGYEALTRDVARYLTGGSEPLFVGAEERELLAAFTRSPESRVVRLSFESEAGARHPVAVEAALAPVRALDRSGTRRAPPPILAAAVGSSGVAELDPPGCARVRIEVDAWSCAVRRLCWPSHPFLVATEVGCGAPTPLVIASYAAGEYAGATADVQARIAVESVASGGQLDVLRVRVALREPPPTDAP